MVPYLRLISLTCVLVAGANDSSDYVQILVSSARSNNHANQSQTMEGLAVALTNSNHSKATCEVTLYEHWAADAKPDYTGGTHTVEGTGNFKLDSWVLTSNGKKYGASSVKVSGQGCAVYGYETEDCSGDETRAITSVTQLDGLPAGVVSPGEKLEEYWGCNDCVRCVRVEQPTTAAGAASDTAAGAGDTAAGAGDTAAGAGDTAAGAADTTNLWGETYEKKECGTDDSWEVSTEIGGDVTRQFCQDTCAKDQACIGFEYGIEDRCSDGNKDSCKCYKITTGCSKQQEKKYNVYLKPIGQPWAVKYEGKECGNDDGFDVSTLAGAEMTMEACQRQCEAESSCPGFEYGLTSNCNGDDNCKCYILNKECSKQQDKPTYSVYLKPS